MSAGVSDESQSLLCIDRERQCDFNVVLSRESMLKDDSLLRNRMYIVPLE